MAIENPEFNPPEVKVDLPELKVPHPHLFDRPFFINPLKELLGKA